MTNVKRINPITSIRKDKIPQEYSTFLDRSKNGVILVSFGSMLPNTNNTIYTKLVTAFRNTKYDFIIKGDFVKGNERMMVSKWIPQRSLLSHKNIKLFITHCGANGIGEAISNGVPMLGFPIFAEQPGNAHNMAARGYGLSMELFTAKSDEILANINEVIKNSSYKSNVNKASQILKELNERNNSTEEATFWIEHVLKFGGDYMRSSSVDMPLYQYLILDVLLFILLAVSVVLAILFYCFKICYSRMCGRKMKSE
ncbi:UDP-glucuronosyltransferase 2B7 [Patella vulgata]|uniref:UDP-glucuronosyltransferase 2B7 n=1 Tax=Patella vulgata TaxID=6465 RepID=UPI0021800D88|nr:UDP-glucuronosyltransferase 2B7 [Patella vulgata]